MKPRILILIGAFWPGHESAGPNLSVKTMCQALSDEFDFLLVARDRPFGATEALVANDAWFNLGWAKIHYLTVGRNGAEGLAALLRDTPHDVLFSNGFFDREFTIPALLARRFGKAPRRPTIIAPRGEFSSGALGLKGGRKGLYRRIVTALGLAKQVTFQVTSTEEEADIRAAFPRNPVERIGNVRPLFALPGYCPGATFRAAFLGRISPVKGLDIALEALALVRQRVDFTIYGPVSDAAHWARCGALIAALPTNVTAHHAGELTNDAVPRAMAAQDVLLLPSRSENFGHAIFEALAAGTPVVIGDKTPWRGLEAAKAGFDIALPDPVGIAAAIDRLAAMSAADRAAWRAGARAAAEAFVASSTARTDMTHLFHRLAGH
ncbi:MAG: glycosyltransferase [Sphingomonas sp.]|uniref:glycosyltransferase n=1 Tax=Sphingomonas sp. TaxID=28214 RepID=UPI00121B4CDE|nr:glycosyltransferase [Sphingomonas sp.]THD37157.1 MAG: glycosyltransferase [Sphingomonas sp.]